MPQYPDTLTTSDWIDCLAGKSRDEQIAALATFHRRVEFTARHATIENLAVPADHDAKASPQELLAAVVNTARAAIADPANYKANG